MLIIGIDPGISGSICFFENGKILDVIEMPTMTDGKKNKRQVNGSQIYNEILKKTVGFNKENIRVVIEQVSAMQLPVYFVRPAKWKKYFNLLNSEKDASRTRAIEIFPYFSSHLSKKKDSNKADAILIASFYYETYKIED